MNKARRILALLMATVLVCMIFTGCDTKPDDGKIRIGICQPVEHSALQDATTGFKDAVIAAFGEENVEFDVQSAQNDLSVCVSIINQFVSNDVDLILANATSALQAAASATKDIPVLGTSVTDYGSALGIKGFDGTVGGNVSGTSDIASIKEQAAMITEWFPEAKKVALLYCSAESNSQYQVDAIAEELKLSGIEVAHYPFADSNDLFAVCTSAAENSDVVFVPTDNTVASNTGIINNVSTMVKTPIIGGDKGICKGCSVAAQSIEYYELGYKTGEMAAEILKGEANISEMPIEYAPSHKIYNEELCEFFKITPVEGYEK